MNSDLNRHAAKSATRKKSPSQRPSRSLASWRLNRILLLPLLILFLLLDSAPSFAQRDISTLLSPIVERNKVPALAGSIVTSTELEAVGAAGVRASGHPEKTEPGDLYHLGSCTKAMTATMIATLVEEGKLKWTTTVEEIFVPYKREWNPAWKKVTLEQLLCHRAGAPHELDKDGLWSRLWARNGTPTEQRNDLIDTILRWEPASAPGEKFLYSNAGYTVADMMAEKVAGAPWEELMRKRIFEPLGMKSAGFGSPGEAGKLDQPLAHDRKGKPIEPGKFSDNPPSIGPGGIVHCTMADWGKFIREHLVGESGKGKLLKADTYKKLHTPYDAPGSDYAMGWGVASRPWGGRVLTHNGSNNSWFCVAWLAPDKGFAVIAACNQAERGDKATDDAAAALIQDHLAHAGK